MQIKRVRLIDSKTADQVIVIIGLKQSNCIFFELFVGESFLFLWIFEEIGNIAVKEEVSEGILIKIRTITQI